MSNKWLYGKQRCRGDYDYRHEWEEDEQRWFHSAGDHRNGQIEQFSVWF
jgi:hypothetical protein